MGIRTSQRGELQTIPKDLLGKISSYCSEQDIESLAYTSKNLSHIIAKILHQRRLASIKNILTLSPEFLNTTQADFLNRIKEDLENSPVINYSTLLSLKHHFQIKKQILDILTGPAKEDLGEREVVITIKNIFNPLVEIGEYDLAIQVFEFIDDSKLRNSEEWGWLLIVNDTCQILVEKGNFNKAIELAKAYPSNLAKASPKKKQQRTDLFLLISDHVLSAVKKWDPKDTERWSMLRKLSRELAEEGEFEEATKVAGFIPEEQERQTKLQNIEELQTIAKNKASNKRWCSIL